MKLLPQIKEKIVSLKGAVQINNSSFFVFEDECGKTFIKNGKDENTHKSAVENMMNLNPHIKSILKKYKIKPIVDIKTLKDLTGGHMNDTCHIALGLYSILSKSMGHKIDKTILKEASMLHDLGKVLIPSKILNKPAKLTQKERRIMNIHSILGYELLKTQPLSQETLDLIKYHHQNLNHSGYPKMAEIHVASDLELQIISTADKYSALREARVYRKPLSRLDSLLILYKEVREGKIHQKVFDALVEYAETYDC